MFEFTNNYTKEVQEVIDKIETQMGIRVVSAAGWTLPVKKCQLALKVKMEKPLNIVEEFVIKVIISGIKNGVTQSDVSSILGLDEVFVEACVKTFTSSEIIDSKNLPKLIMTDSGIQNFNKGIISVACEEKPIEAFVENRFGLFYNELPNKSIYPIWNFMEDTADFENNQELQNQIINAYEQKGTVVNPQTVIGYNAEWTESIGYAAFAQFWIYDIIDDKLYCKVWDFNLKKYSNVLGEYAPQDNPLSGEDLERFNTVRNNETVKKYESMYRDEFNKAQLEKGTVNEIELNVRVIRNKDIIPEFKKCLIDVQNYMLIYSPWIRKEIVTDEIIKNFESMTARGVHLFIGWGMQKDLENENLKGHQHEFEALVSKLNDITGPNGLPAVHIYWIGEHHTKEIIVDNNMAMLGSYNWLSSSGYNGESVSVIKKPEIVKENKTYWEEKFFEKISSGFWQKDYVKGINPLRQLNTLLNLEIVKDKVESFMTIETQKFFAEPESLEVYDNLYNMALVYFKNNLFDYVYKNIISFLVEKNKFLEEIYIMCNYVNIKNKTNIFNEIIEKCKNNLAVDNLHHIDAEKLLFKGKSYNISQKENIINNSEQANAEIINKNYYKIHLLDIANKYPDKPIILTAQYKHNTKNTHCEFIAVRPFSVDGKTKTLCDCLNINKKDVESFCDLNWSHNDKRVYLIGFAQKNNVKGEDFGMLKLTDTLGIPPIVFNDDMNLVERIKNDKSIYRKSANPAFLADGKFYKDKKNTLNNN